MLSVACVLKSGPEFTYRHVRALKAGVSRHLTLPHRFVCLTDMNVDCEAIPLCTAWPGWWAKINLLAPNQFDGPVLYFDLDSIIVGSLNELALGHTFTMLENFWRPDRVGSGMMAWNTDLSSIYETFARSSKKFMDEYRTPDKWGDQAFIKDHTPIKPELWQRKHPAKVVSYKLHVRDTGRVPKSAAAVLFHGQPRPWQTPLWKAA